MNDFTIPADAFRGLMHRTIALVGQKMTRETLQAVSQVFQVMRWDFKDLGTSIFFLLSSDGAVRSADAHESEAQSTLQIDARTFHDAAYGRTSLGTAFLLGRLKVRGIPALKLGKFTPLLKPFLESYRQACEEMAHVAHQ